MEAPDNQELALWVSVIEEKPSAKRSDPEKSLLRLHGTCTRLGADIAAARERVQKGYRVGRISEAEKAAEDVAKIEVKLQGATRARAEALAELERAHEAALDVERERRRRQRSTFLVELLRIADENAAAVERDAARFGKSVRRLVHSSAQIVSTVQGLSAERDGLTPHELDGYVRDSLVGGPAALRIIAQALLAHLPGGEPVDALGNALGMAAASTGHTQGRYEGDPSPFGPQLRQLQSLVAETGALSVLEAPEDDEPAAAAAQ